MAPIFDREAVLASQEPPILPVSSLALDFALLGEVDVARDILSLLNREYPIHGLEESLRHLNLAWVATGKWPEGTEQFEDDDERDMFRAECDAELWPESIDEDERTEDEAGLKRALGLADAIDKGKPPTEDSEDDETAAEAMAEYLKSSALVKALDLSIKAAEEKAGKAPLDKLDDRSQSTLARISDRLHIANQTQVLASSTHAWPYLARGVLATTVGTNKDKLHALGKEITETLAEWFKRGPEVWKPSDKSLKELFQICSDKSREFWELEFDEPAPDTLFAPSGASDKDIAELEKKLDASLPADYKEFLGITDGFKEVIADGIFEDFEVPLHPTSEVTWRKADELFTELDDAEGDDLDEEGDDEIEEVDEDGGEKESGRPAKKIKLASGDEATTKEAGDEADDDEDEDGIDLAALQKAMGTPRGFLGIELLALPDVADLQLEGDNEDEEWPSLEKVVEIGSDDAAYLWLLPAEQVRKARDVYVRMLDRQEDEQIKKAIRWAMTAFVGSEEAFRKLDGWAVVAWSGGRMNYWSSFRRYAQELAETCLKLEKVEDEEEAEKEETLAYSCR